MVSCCVRCLLFVLISVPLMHSQAPTQSPSSSSKHAKRPATAIASALDPGSIANNEYRNTALGFSYKIREGWVLRTDALNAREEEKPGSGAEPAASSAGAQVLLAAFSRPPEARGEEVNSSILIAAEKQASYPGLKEAAQYLGPVTEVAKAQGFTEEEGPYEVAVETKTLARADFKKDVGTRVMHQSTLAMLTRGYAISITVIAGTEEEIEELIDGLTFAAAGK